jgi:putative ABC transport system permease protein
MLTSVGLGGVIAQTVVQRRREFGIRVAIGAGRLDIIRLVLREGLAVTTVGAATGLTIASWLTHYMRATLFGVTPLDGVAFAAAPLFVIGAAMLACAYPAFRAASTDPAVALRAE